MVLDLDLGFDEEFFDEEIYPFWDLILGTIFVTKHYFSLFLTLGWYLQWMIMHMLSASTNCPWGCQSSTFFMFHTLIYHWFVFSEIIHYLYFIDIFQRLVFFILGKWRGRKQKALSSRAVSLCLFSRLLKTAVPTTKLATISMHFFSFFDLHWKQVR